MIAQQLLESTALIFIFAFAASLIRAKFLSLIGRWNDLIIGLTYAAITVFGMTSPLVISEGVRYDARSAFIGVVALCYGLRPTIVAAAIPIVFRIWVGGIGVIPGVLSITASAVIGLWLYTYFLKKPRLPSWLEMFGIGTIFAASALVWTALLPQEIRDTILFDNGFSIVGIHILATMIFGGLEYENQKSIRNRQSAIERDHLLRTAEKVAELGFLFVNLKTQKVRASASLQEMLQLKNNYDFTSRELVDVKVAKIDHYKTTRHFSSSEVVGSEIVFRMPRAADHDRIFSSRYICNRSFGANEEAVFLVLDLTEKQTLLEKASHSARLATLGETASKISHEIVNPLTAALLLNERLRNLVNKQPAPDQELISLTNRLENRLDSTLHLVRTISGFSRAKPEHFGPQHIHEDIIIALELFQDIVGGREIYTSVDLIATNDLVTASPLHIQQILLNLLSNARDALESSPEPKIEVKTYNEDNFLVIEVNDNGPGIAEGTRKKIFEPFFTTKERGRGTGLGLSIVQSLVSEMKGVIATNERQKGTSFILKFPIAD